jgi:hypothetical protein
MNKTIKIYCEGNQKSHDFEILKKIFNNKNVFISPIGSKKGAEETIEIYENGREKSNAFLFFRDRDFDVPVPEKPSLTQKGFTFYSYRTTIENYLLDATCFFDFIKERKFQKKYKINSVSDVQNLFIKAAKKISYYQALRHTLGQLSAPDDFKTTWMSKGSGHLPLQIDDKNFCRNKALERVPQHTEDAFDAHLNAFLERFEITYFYENGDYLVWFQGKDLAKALCLLLPNFPMAGYYRFAKMHFDYRKFEDLVELREVIGGMCTQI